MRSTRWKAGSKVMPDAVVPQLDAPWYRLTVRDLPIEGGEPFTVVVPDPGVERPPVPVDAAVGRIRFGQACPDAGVRPLASGAGGRSRCFVGDSAATRAAIGSWVSTMAPCLRGVVPCGPEGHPVVVWVDARDAGAVERSLIVTGFQLLAGITASQPAFLARAVALEWLGRTEGWVMVIEGDRGAELAGWLLRRFRHGTFAFSAQRSPQPPGACFSSGVDVVVSAELASGPAGRHFADLGMGTTGDFGENGDMIGLYSSLAGAAGERDPAGTADRLWAAGDYVRAFRLQRLAARVPDAGGADRNVERVRLENNLACLYSALLRPREAVAVLEACRDRYRSGRQHGNPVPEIVEVNLGLCYLQLTDMTARHSGHMRLDSAAEAHLADLDRRSASALERYKALQSLEDTARRARLAAVSRHRERAVTVFEALLGRHHADTDSPYACHLRDCLAFSLLAGYDGYSVWPASAASSARALFQENVIWHGMVSGESADITLRSRIREATVVGMTSGSVGAQEEAMAELRQVLDIAGETSTSAAAQCALALSHLAIECAPDDAVPYAAAFAEYCLQAAGPEHPWARFAASHLELLRTQLPAVAFQPGDPYPASVKVWEGPYGARPVPHLDYPVVVPYLLAGDVPGAAARCYETAAAATAQREAAADFHAELRAALERRCNLELNDIQRHEGASADFAWLSSLLTETLDSDSGILQSASPYTVFIHGC